MSTTETGWTRRPTSHELMAESDPAYREVASRCLIAARGWQLRPDSRVLDAWAGTGIISVPLAQALPQCTVIHLEPDPALCAAAREKASEAGVRNLEFLQCDLESANFIPGSMGAIVWAHKPSAQGDPLEASGLLAEWLAPSGLLFAFDMTPRHGWMGTVKTLWNGYLGAFGTRRRDPGKFRVMFENAGLRVEDAYDCYCGCCDVVICRKPVS